MGTGSFGRPWTMAELARLRALAEAGKSTAETAAALGRSFDAVRERARLIGAKFARQKPGPRQVDCSPGYARGERFEARGLIGRCRVLVIAASPEAAAAFLARLTASVAAQRQARERAA